MDYASLVADDETRLEQAERHAAEGRDRLIRQRKLIEHLEADGHDRMLPQARFILGEMEKSQRMFEEHLAEERRKSPSS